MPLDQAELVAAAKDGDRSAFDELVRVTYADTYTLAYRLTGDEEDARDVVQESYLRAYRGLKRFRGDAALRRLPPRLRAVVVLRDVYDLPHEAIADELGISESAAKVRLHRARRKLRERLFPLRGEEDARAV